ncbi:Fic family protein [Lachnospiraceae bacterium 48-42]|jgi:Uncharacterized conserved protein
MYESYEVLKIKKKSGITAARQELDFRNSHREKIPLEGLENTVLYMVQTGEMRQRLLSIESLYHSLDHRQKAKEIILLDAYHSATIEGARTTVENVRKSYHNPYSKDDKMVVNTVHALNYAYKTPIDLHNIRYLWEIITKDVCENARLSRSLFRDGMVYVGSHTEIIHTPAKPEKIKEYMERLFLFLQEQRYNPWLNAAVFHFYFAYIHPFCDGNGRTARVITQSYLYHCGLEKIRYLPLSRTINQKLAQYYQALKESETIHVNGEKWIDITPFLDYSLEIAEESMLVSMREDHAFGEREKLLIEKMQKRGKGTEINRTATAKILHVSEQTAGRLLNGLVEKGYLDKVRRGKRYIFILK